MRSRAETTDDAPEDATDAPAPDGDDAPAADPMTSGTPDAPGPPDESAETVVPDRSVLRKPVPPDPPPAPAPAHLAAGRPRYGDGLPRLLAALAPVVVAVAVAGLLFRQDDRYGVAGGCLAAGVVVGLLVYVAWRRLPPGWRGSPQRRTVAAGIVAALALVVGGGVFGVARVPVSVPAVGAVAVEGGASLTASKPAVVVFAGATSDHDRLGLRLNLADDVPDADDCTQDATLTLTPQDGERVLGPPVQMYYPGTPTQEAQEVEVPLDRPVANLRVEVALHAAYGCTVRMDLADAVFYG